MIKQTICGIVAAAALACSGQPNQEPKYETITGTPLSVAQFSGRLGGYVSTVIQTEGKTILTQSDYCLGVVCSNAEALIQSEITDGDDEPIELTGQYQADGTFKFSKVKANGMTINNLF